jgi:hypothetical protein
MYRTNIQQHESGNLDERSDTNEVGNMPTELAWKPPKDPTKELGATYWTLVDTFIGLASIPCSIIASTTSDVDRKPDLSSNPTAMVSHHEETLKACSTSEPLIWTLLGALACRYECCDPAHEPDRALVVFTVGRALEALHADIARQGRLHARHLQAIRYLCAAEVYRRDYVAAKVHLRAARKMLDAYAIEHAGSTQGLGWMFTRADVVTGACSSEKPIFSDVYDPGPLHQVMPAEVVYEALNKPSLRRLGSALLRLPENVIPSQLATLIEDIRIATAIVTIDTKAVDVSTPAGYWLSAQCDALHHRIWSIRASGPTTQAVQLALIAWLTTLQSPVSAAKLIAAPLQGLLRINRAIFDDPSFRRTSIWILFLGAMATFGELESWFLHELLAQLRLEGCAFKESLLDILGNYFLLEDHHRVAILATMSRLYGEENI